MGQADRAVSSVLVFYGVRQVLGMLVVMQFLCRKQLIAGTALMAVNPIANGLS